VTVHLCLQAGETIGQADSQDGSQGYDTWSNERLSQWLVAVVEAPSAGATGSARGTVELGVVAVETSTGAVQYSQFRQAFCLLAAKPTACSAGCMSRHGACHMVWLPHPRMASAATRLHCQIKEASYCALHQHAGTAR